MFYVSCSALPFILQHIFIFLFLIRILTMEPRNSDRSYPTPFPRVLLPSSNGSSSSKPAPDDVASSPPSSPPGQCAIQERSSLTLVYFCLMGMLVVAWRRTRDPFCIGALVLLMLYRILVCRSIENLN